MKSETFRIKENSWWSEQVMDFIDYNINEDQDLLVTITIDKV